MTRYSAPRDVTIFRAQPNGALAGDTLYAVVNVSVGSETVRFDFADGRQCVYVLRHVVFWTDGSARDAAAGKVVT